jgi:hypothetical protein
MASARPVAGAGLGDQYKFGLANTTNAAATIAPLGWDTRRVPITGSVYYTDQNGAAVWFAFEGDYDSPNNLNAAFTFGGSSGVTDAGIKRLTGFGIADIANQATSISTQGRDFHAMGRTRAWHTTTDSKETEAGKTDLRFDSLYLVPPIGNTAFYFGGTMVVAAAGCGHVEQFGDIADIRKPLQINPEGWRSQGTFGNPRMGDQPAVTFSFDGVTAGTSPKNVAFDFGLDKSATLTAGNQAQFGVTALRNSAQSLAVLGSEFTRYGQALCFDINSNGATAHFGFAQSYSLPPSALNTPFYFAWESRAITEGWQSEQWGEPYTWLFHSFADPAGWRATKFGNTHIENWAEFAATPVGIPPAGMGAPKLEIAPRYILTLRADLPSLNSLTADITYQSKAERPTVGEQTTSWQSTSTNDSIQPQRQQDAHRLPAGWNGQWYKTKGSSSGITHPLPQVLTTDNIHLNQPYESANWNHQSRTFTQQDATSLWLQKDHHQRNAQRNVSAIDFEQQDGIRTNRRYQAIWNIGRPQAFVQHYRYQMAMPLPKGWRTLFQACCVPPIGTTRIAVTELEQPDSCYLLSTDLVFSKLSSVSTQLLFLCDTAEVESPTVGTLIIPIQKVYIVLNNVNLMRASDQTLVPTYTMSLSLDAGSWAWGFEASLPGVAQGLVEPTADDPVELIANVNGTAFRVLAESLNRERVFGETRIRVSGRSKHALLDTPYAPILSFNNTTDRSHQQLFDDVLQVNGVPLGWQIDYGLESWNVPLSAFAHQGTYISALAALAKAGGAYLLPDTQQNLFKVLPRYPATPWNWGDITPDVVLPIDAVSRESISWKDKPAYNRVYVSGEGQGILGQVTRSGTAGDILAPMVTDSLITTAAAARQRGLAILSDTGRQLEMGLKLPVLPTTGIIQPGAFVQYDDDGTSSIGLVRSTHIDVGLPDVFQTLGVECHA